MARMLNAAAKYSRSTSRILRMDNLLFASVHPLLQKQEGLTRRRVVPRRSAPTGGRSISTGISDRFQPESVIGCGPESVIGLDRNTQAVVRGDHLGVVCFAVDPPATVAAVAAPALVDELRAALGAAGAPATTAPRSLPLPAAVDAAVSDTPCDVVLFDDADGDGGWSRGEGYVTAWSGGRGSVRLVHRTGGGGGWRLIEGGSPTVERPLPAGRTVAVDPVVEAIEAR